MIDVASIFIYFFCFLGVFRALEVIFFSFVKKEESTMGKIVYEITEDMLNLYFENAEVERKLFLELPIEVLDFSEVVNNIFSLKNSGFDISLELKSKSKEETDLALVTSKLNELCKKDENESEN